MDSSIRNVLFELWIVGSEMLFLTYGFMDPECNDFVSFFFICRSMDSSEEFEQELYDGVDVCDDDIEKSLSKSKIYECTNAFTR